MFLSNKISFSGDQKCLVGSKVVGYLREISGRRIFIQWNAPTISYGDEQTLDILISSNEHVSLKGAFTSLDKKESPKENLQIVCFEVTESDSEVLANGLSVLRKDQHIDICARLDVESSDKYTGFSNINFLPKAIPEVGLEKIDISTEVFGCRFSAPLMITGMTGGVEKGEQINKTLAVAAAKFNIPMGVGSQRVALDHPDNERLFQLKPSVSGLFLIGNLGCSQLLRADYLDLCQKAIDMIGADALAIHLNILQECMQMEGDREFQGIFDRLERVCEKISVPVVVKEVGCGIDLETFRRLISIGVSAVDVGGKGGTSWGYIEGLRSSQKNSLKLAEDFRDWGIPTAINLKVLRSEASNFPIFATGGIRSGLIVAKAAALGANLCGIGLPLFRAALESPKAVEEYLQYIVDGLKTSLIVTGSTCLEDLKQKVTLGVPYEREFAHLMGME